MPNSVTVPDRMYDAETVEAISRLRQERWLILAVTASHADGTMPIPERMVDHYRFRLAQVNKELYTLTDNPIYDV